MKVFLATIALVMVGAFVSCSSNDNSPSNSPTRTGATTRTATTSASGGNTVNVKLQEWSINPDVDSVNAGPVTFNVKNIGPAQRHEFVILKTDLATADLPKKDDGTVDEEGAGVTSPGEVADLAVGEEKSTTIDLTPGKYLFVCNLVDQQGSVTELHFTNGMVKAFTVR
jgi:uncharacterized cupredoxin-like copper-binding protein